jgi:hypothetical protein
LRSGIIKEGKFSETVLDASVKAPRPFIVNSVSNLLAPSESPMRPVRTMDSPNTASSLASPLVSPLASPQSHSRTILGNTTPVMPLTKVLRSSVAATVASGEFPSTARAASLFRASERTPPVSTYFSPGLAFREISPTVPPLFFEHGGLR